MTPEELARLKRMCVFEEEALALGYQHIAGVDEAGRGPLAGPVVAAACVIPPGLYIQGVNDSKVLSLEKRYALFQQVVALQEVDWAVGVVDALLIDQVNILRATFEAMVLAITQLRKQPGLVLVDGPHVPCTKIPCKPIIKGDSKSQSIALASVIAKHKRDEMMEVYHQKWPEYGFNEHKGYGTKKHLQAIMKHGLSPIHRKTFKPCSVFA